MLKEIEIKNESLQKTKEMHEEVERLRKTLAEREKTDSLTRMPTLENSEQKGRLRRSSSSKQLPPRHVGTVNAKESDQGPTKPQENGKDGGLSFHEIEKRLTEKIESLTTDLKAANGRASDLEKQVLKVQEESSRLAAEREGIVASLREACAENIQLRQGIEDVLKQKVQRDSEVTALRDEKLALGLSVSALEQKVQSVKEDLVMRDKKIDELRAKVLSPEQTAFVYNVIKESIIGKEALLVS